MKDFIIRNKNKTIYSFIWIFIWHILAKSIDNSILLPLPSEVFTSFLSLLGSIDFWVSLLNSLFKIGLGFCLGLLIGLFLGLLSYKLPKLRDLLDIPMSIIKSVPIASIAVILLVWLKSDKLPIAVVFLVVLPSIFYSSYEALVNTDKKLLEMAYVFRLKKSKIIRYIYLDKLKEHLLPSIIITSGLAWKSGVSAEVLGLVKNSIGENIYYSKLYLDTKELFAWTMAIIIISKFFEVRLKKILVRIGKNE